jgi:hypothetical protein
MERSDIRGRPGGKTPDFAGAQSGYTRVLQMRECIMRSKIKSPITVGVAIALVFAVGLGDALARSNKHKTVVVVHPLYAPISPYAPYYYSPWNPYSLYSIYDHLSGGRQLCHLPSEPCDNEHRVQN